MSSAVLIPVVIVAGAACPLHMWWQNRRGRQAACPGTEPARQGELDVSELRARHQRLSLQIAELEARAARADEAEEAAAELPSLIGDRERP